VLAGEVEAPVFLEVPAHRIQRRRALITGFLGQTGLSLDSRPLWTLAF